jgi:hypothetical protein
MHDMSRSGFRPNFDSLEAREVPAVNIYSLSGGSTLRIVGTKDWDEVRITQDDTNDTLEIYSCVLPKSSTASIADVESQTFISSKVKRIIIDTGIGNDCIYYKVAEGSDLLFAKTFAITTGAGNDLVDFETASVRPDLTNFYNEQGGFASAMHYGESETVDETSDTEDEIAFCYAPPMHSTIRANVVASIDTGTGNDKVKINVGAIDQSKRVRFVSKLGNGDDNFALTGNYGLAERASLFVDVNAGNGNDFVDTTFTCTIADRALVDVLVHGGAGNDTINTGLFSQVHGRFNVRQQGGAGNDELALNSNVSSDSIGLVDVLLDGDEGSDDITYSALGNDDPAVADVFIDGGTGYNIGKLSRDVMCVNINEILWLPPMV